MGLLNFGDLRVLLVGILITAVMITIGCWKKKSVFCAIMLFIFLGLLIFHVVSMSSGINLTVDFTGIIASITSYLIIDEIEIRRKKINQVFEDRYKN
ncbi:MAG: hypothetical protein IJ217_02830 [Clostridia bacterium]|nr:hypothetical protein [Clostridia bacterium]